MRPGAPRDILLAQGPIAYPLGIPIGAEPEIRAMPSVAEIHFDGVPPSATLSAAIRKRWRELVRRYDDLVDGHVTVCGSCTDPAGPPAYGVDVCLRLGNRWWSFGSSRDRPSYRNALQAVHVAFDGVTIGPRPPSGTTSWR